MVIVIICVLGGHIDGFYGYYLARPARCGTTLIIPFEYLLLSSLLNFEQFLCRKHELFKL